MKLFYFLFIVLAAFLGCKKNALLNLNGKYVSDDVFLIENPIMYTAGNSISNIEFIKNYLQRKKNTNYFVFDASTLPISGSPLYINFLSGNKVDLEGMPGYMEQGEITGRNNDRLLISSMDSAVYFPPNTSNRCELLVSKITEVVPEVNCSAFYVLPGPGGFPSVGGCKYRPAFPMVISGNNLYLPLFSYSVSYSNSSFVQCASATSGIINLFSKDFLKELKAGDTIVIQKRKLLMKKEG